VDRRRLVRRVHKLESELARLERRRKLQRRGRRGSRLSSVSIVGYTNAGKSTLLNALTGAGVVADARLFATLDPRTRRFALPGGELVLVSDTVGFVRKLPHQLVEAFRSTLEVVNEADVLVHVVDSSAPEPEGQIDAVRAVLGEIGAADIPELLVFNKADLVPGAAEQLARRYPGATVISAVTGQGIGELLGAVAHQLRLASRIVELDIPYSRGDLLAALHREGEVLTTREDGESMFVQARLPVAALAQFSRWARGSGRERPSGATAVTGAAGPSTAEAG
jgi:GTP-binding protein HflX